MATQPDQVEDERTSIFQSSLPLEAKLERARTELLDLSARNRLLNIPRSAKAARTLEIVDEQTAEVFRLLVRDQRPFTFLAGRSAADAASDEEEIAELAQPDDSIDERGVANRHSDTKFQTRLTPAGLQKRLLDLYFDARTLEEEQGVNILFLALGTLKWVDPNNADNVRFAPLILIPVALERGNAAEKFKLRWRQEEPAPNLSLEAYLDRVHGLKMPAFEGGDDFDPTSYIATVAEAVSSKPGWSVQPDDIVLGFFSFAKFLMYRDLDPEVWPKQSRLAEHLLMKSLISDGFDPSDEMLDEDARIDDHISPSEMLHIVDCDSSQTLAVHEVRRGRNLVIQGPPGTGKSQTIANIIASAVADGKTVLFVAEKMAALEVVKRRLDRTGVGDACLEIHSNKANKRALLEELRRTWELGAPKGDKLSTLNSRLTEARDRLNQHAERMHIAVGAANLTPYQVVGHLSRLRHDGQQPNDLRLDEPESWTADALQLRLSELAELVERVTDIGVPTDHTWRGVGLETILPPDVDRAIARITALATRLEAIIQEHDEIAAQLEVEPPFALTDLDRLHALAKRIADAPNLVPEALGSTAWDMQSQEIAALVQVGKSYASLFSQLDPLFETHAWQSDVEPIREALVALPTDFSLAAFERLARLNDLLPKVSADAARLAETLGQPTPTTLAASETLAAIGERVAAAPEANAEAFAADLWDGGVERAGDLARAVEELEKSRSEVSTRLSDAAWTMDLAQARTTLGAHGTSLFRILNGEWRQANRLVRSVLTTSKAPLDEILPLLDALARGQKATAQINADDDFGRRAFSTDWRGVRSASAPLIALVEWMRTLRGLGAEPRMIASRRPDRRDAQERSDRLDRHCKEARNLLGELWNEAGKARTQFFADVDASALAELKLVEQAVERHHNAHEAYKAIAKTVPLSVVERLRAVNELAKGQRAVSDLEAGGSLAEKAFGPAWGATQSDWAALAGAVEWIASNLDIHALASRISDRTGLVSRIGVAGDARARFLGDLFSLLTDLDAETHIALGESDPAKIGTASFLGRLVEWRSSSETLSKWVAYRGRAERGRELGFGQFVHRLHDGRMQPGEALSNFEMTYYEAIFRAQVASQPELSRFDGDLHTRAVREFADLDNQRIAASSFEVVREHHKRIPAFSGGAVGPLGILKSEIARKRGHMPIRQLMMKAAPAVQALKPVFMMSPLSVAQFLPPGVLKFDLLVMDEASQIQPVDALGAIARSKQVVVVGDPQQLPPTAFFAKVTGNSDADDEQDGAKVADIESILGLFTARGLPMRMLRWHYRSRHQSLIAVSNKQFYENKLFIVPSPYTAEAGVGLRFHFIENGIFESGTTRTNPIEAKAVAKAIIAHAMTTPELSLGVAAFSAAQRRAILDQLELLRRALPPQHEAFFQQHPAEPFFVKNLENVQGDERDVILISVGYGPTAPGLKPPMRFGPLGIEGGERRLNVLISRAKRRCEVFASMSDEDIDPDFAATRKGVFAFKLFMHFARTGKMVMAETTGRDHDSVFEEQVAKALHERGYQVHRQVGIAGIFIDLAVADPERADRYLIGIECDGASYHGARSARDRDRLRQAVLEDHGWIMHRIWSSDWFQRPKEQLDKTIAAIEAAKAELLARGERTQAASRAGALEIFSIEREGATEIGLGAAADATVTVDRYEEAMVERPGHLSSELHDTPRGILTALAEQVVAVEGPVHIDEVINRIRDAWGLKRAGGRIQEAVDKAVDVAVRLQRLQQDGDFLSIPGAIPKVRDRSETRSLSLRKPEALPPAELAVAVVEVVRSNFGATEDQIVQAVARAVGFKSTSGQLRSVMQSVIADAVKRQDLARQQGIIVLGPNAPTARPEPPTPVEKLISEGEHDGLEFKQTLRWDTQFNQPNRKLEEVVVKTIAGFANRNGGTLLVGVCDDGSVVGIEADMACLGGNSDKMELHLTNLLNNHFGQAFRATRIAVSFPVMGVNVICRIDVKRAASPVFVTISDRNGQAAERFFVRTGNSTNELMPSQISTYVREHFA